MNHLVPHIEKEERRKQNKKKGGGGAEEEENSSSKGVEVEGREWVSKKIST